MMYISITGLKLKSPLYLFKFYKLAVTSMIQAQNSEGNLFAEAKKINGVRHTLSAWRSKEDMQNFLYQGAHLKAIKSFNSIASGKTFGYESETIPNWHEVHKLYLEKAKDYK